VTGRRCAFGDPGSEDPGLHPLAVVKLACQAEAMGGRQPIRTIAKAGASARLRNFVASADSWPGQP